MTHLRITLLVIACSALAACTDAKNEPHEGDDDAEVNAGTPGGRGGSSGNGGSGGSGADAGPRDEQRGPLVRPALPRAPNQRLPADLRPPR